MNNVKTYIFLFVLSFIFIISSNSVLSISETTRYTYNNANSTYILDDYGNYNLNNSLNGNTQAIYSFYNNGNIIIFYKNESVHSIVNNVPDLSQADDLTVCAFIKPENDNVNAMTIWNYHGNFWTIGWSLYTNNEIKFYLGNNSLIVDYNHQIDNTFTVVTYRNSHSITLTESHYVCFSNNKDLNESYLYIDDILVNTTYFNQSISDIINPSASTINQNFFMSIGVSQKTSSVIQATWSPINYYNGSIGQVTIWNNVTYNNTTYSNGFPIEYYESTLSTADNWNVSIDMSNVILNNAGVYDVYLTGIPLTATATYYIQSNVTPFYLSTVCEVQSTSAESQLVVDLFEYTNLTQNGWIGVCPDFTTAVIKTNLNRSLYINSTSCQSTMSKIIPTYALGNNLNIQYDTFPVGETNYTIGIKSNTYQDMIKLQYVYDGTTMCIYSNFTYINNLIHCIPMNSVARDELVNSIVMNLGTEQSFNLDTYVVNSLGTMISEQHSTSVPLINSSLQAGYVTIQNYASVSDFFFDFLVVESISRVLPFTLVTSPHVEECLYDNVSKFYQTNFYYQANNVTGYNNVKSFIATGKSITKSEAQLNLITPTNPPVGNATVSWDNREQSFINSLFGSNLTTSQKLFYAIMVLFVAGLMIVIFASSFGMDAVLTGVLTVTIELTLLIFFAFIGFIPVWIIIIIAIIAAGIVAMFMKKALTQ
jgi:hypothetical protein